MRYVTLILLFQLLRTLEGKQHHAKPQKELRTKKLRSGGLDRPKGETIVRTESTIVQDKGPKLQKEPASQGHHHHPCLVYGTKDCDKNHDGTQPHYATTHDSASDAKVESQNKKSTGAVFHFAVDDANDASHSKAHFDILWRPDGPQHQQHSSFQSSEFGKGGRKHKKYKGKGGKGEKSKGEKGKGKGGKGKRGKGKKNEAYSEYEEFAIPMMPPVTLPPTPHPTTQIVTQRPVIVDPPPRKPDLQPSVAPTPGRLNDPGVFTASPVHVFTRSPSAQSSQPSAMPTLAPSVQPSLVPSAIPSIEPTTPSPSMAPVTRAPAIGPITVPPTESPSTLTPTQSPTTSPTLAPTTTAPSLAPSLAPITEAPAIDPTTVEPTLAPTQRPTVAPTTIEPTLSPTTAAPTETLVDGIVVSVTRFEVDYDVSSSVNDFQFGEAERITLDYLRQFMVDQFAFNSLTDLIDFRGTTVATDNAATMATYDVDLIFSTGSIATPSSEEADLLVFAAFNQPFVPQLVSTLTTLPPGNPFSQTTAVTYNPVERRRWLVELSMIPGPPGLSVKI